MSKPYDATTRLLTQTRPKDWIAYLGLPPGTATVLDADLSTVSLAADRLVRVEGVSPYVLHLEFESGKDTSDVPFRLLQYSVNAKAEFGIAVVSTVFLLHKEADSPQITGDYQEIGPERRAYTTFRYRAVHVWREDAEKLLTGGLSLLPFAPVADVTPAELAQIIRHMEARIDAPLPDDDEAGQFWTAAYVLMRLRYNRAFNAPLLQGVRRMKESVTYQAIVDEGVEQGLERGRLEEAHRLALRAAARRLGPAPTTAQAALEAVTVLETLESLMDRLFEVESWEELLRGIA